MPVYVMLLRPPDVDEEALPQSQLALLEFPQDPSEPVVLSVVQSIPEALTSRSPGEESVTEWSLLVLLCVKTRFAVVTVAADVSVDGSVNLTRPLDVYLLK